MSMISKADALIAVRMRNSPSSPASLWLGLMSCGAGSADDSIADRHRLGFARNYGELCNQDERDRVNVTADTNPDSTGVTQVTRKLTDSENGFLRNASQVLRDRDTKFSPLRKFLEASTATKATLLPPRSPNLNAHLERLMRSLHEECLDRMIFFGEKPLRHALSEFQTHYHSERNHQGLDNQLIDPDQEVGQSSGIIDCRERLGGLLRWRTRCSLPSKEI